MRSQTSSTPRLPPGAVEGSRIARPETWPTVRGVSSARNWASRLVNCRMWLSSRRSGGPSARLGALRALGVPHDRVDDARPRPAGKVVTHAVDLHQPRPRDPLGGRPPARRADEPVLL